MIIEEHPAVSVVVPCYNGERYIEQAIGSALSQTLRPAEVIVVDDGSTDGSARLASAMGATIVTTTGQLGPSAARNAGIRAASGTLIAFLDADDAWLPFHLEISLQAIAEHEAGLVCTRTQSLSPVQNSVPLPAVAPTKVTGRFVSIHELITSNPIPQSTAVVRRQSLLDIGGYDESLRYAEDYELWLRLAATEIPILTLDCITGLRRLHSGQASLALAKLQQSAWNSRLAHLPPSSRSTFHDALAAAIIIDLRNTWHTGDGKAYHGIRRLVAENSFLEPVYAQFRREHDSWPVAVAKSRIRRLLGFDRGA